MSTRTAAGGTIDGPALARWLHAGADALAGARAELDDINVFPVADGDTGTNLALTTAAVAAAVQSWESEAAGIPPGVPTEDDGPGAEEVAGIAAEAALQGARGNSGVILAAWLRGFAEGVNGRAELAGAGLADALRAASNGAARAVGSPQEGTILTVARVAGEGAAARLAHTSEPVTADEVAYAALAAARTSLQGTTSQLPVLAAAGVVDAGGAGLVVLLEALAGVPRVAARRVTAVSPAAAPAADPNTGAAPDARRSADGGGSSGEPGYEVMYLLEAPAQAVPELERALGALGNSLVVSGRPGCYRVHVHVDDVGAAIEAAIDVGRPRQIVVTRFADQPRAGAAGPATADRAVIALMSAAGLSPLLAESGAIVVEGSHQGIPESTEVLHAIRSAGAQEVIVLPNDAAAATNAEAAAALARSDGRTVGVVPTRSVMQGLAALAVHDADAPFAGDLVTMTAAARSTRSGEVMIAEHAALTSAGVCETGQALGLIESDVAVIAQDVESAARQVLDRLLAGGGELVTLVTGVSAPEGLAERLSEHICAGWPAVEVEMHDGASIGHPLLVGVE